MTSFVRSFIGTNGMASQMESIDGKIGLLSQKLNDLSKSASAIAGGETSAGTYGAPPASPPIDINLLLHQSRSSFMRDMPAGATCLLSVGCAGKWYFDWIEQTYGAVQKHVGIEYYASRPDDLPDNVSWIANTAGNMEAIQSDSCDLVVSGQNIEHLWPDEVGDFLVESARVLHPGGTLCVDSPNRAMTAPLLWSHPEHTIEFTVPEIRQLLELAGFDVTKAAGIWLCQDPKTGRFLRFDPNIPDPAWSIPERLISARDKPEQSFLWWLEGRRSNRTPDRQAIGVLLARIFDEAWPERTQRLLVGEGRTIEQRTDGYWVVARPGQGGMVFFGPYMPLRAGRYKITFYLLPDAGTSGAYARCDVTRGMEGEVLRESMATPEARQITLEIELPELTFGCQFRCISLGNAGFAARRHIGLTKL
jgi:hypothetical protein